MLQGTGSDVGKSLLAAGLGRACRRRGLAVRPFKPQNMSNNAAVTADGGEIGRAQALQAQACGLAPTVDMNPVLLKPEGEIGAQVVVQGKVWGHTTARDFQSLRCELLPRVLESYHRIAAAADLVIVEGAGSPAEVNLRAGDIANMGFAEAADVPVALIGDIDRGGVIASIVGTHMLLSPAERARLVGYIVNKFRGDVSLFDGGLAAITANTGLASFGVVPYFPAARRLPAEDALGLADQRPNGLANQRPNGLADQRPNGLADQRPNGLADQRPNGLANQRPNGLADPIRVAVPVFSRIANFDDLDPLVAEPDVVVEFVARGTALPGTADLVVLPGSKATLADLAVLRAEGWDVDIAGHLRRGGVVLGICGGYQMLGRTIRDRDGVEGGPAEAAGLGLLEIETELTPDKTLIDAGGIELASGEPVKGYEMHVGISFGPGLDRPMLRLGDRPAGAVSADGRVYGCYLHGLLAANGFRHHFLNRIRRRADSGIDYGGLVERTLDELAMHLEANLELDRLLEAAGVS